MRDVQNAHKSAGSLALGETDDSVLLLDAFIYDFPVLVCTEGSVFKGAATSSSGGGGGGGFGGGCGVVGAGGEDASSSSFAPVSVSADTDMDVDVAVDGYVGGADGVGSLDAMSMQGDGDYGGVGGDVDVDLADPDNWLMGGAE